jgi:hypothetical protein
MGQRPRPSERTALRRDLLDRLLSGHVLLGWGSPDGSRGPRRQITPRHKGRRKLGSDANHDHHQDPFSNQTEQLNRATFLIIAAQTQPRTESGRFAGRSNRCTPRARPYRRGHPEGSEQSPANALAPAGITLRCPPRSKLAAEMPGGQGFRISLEIRYDRVYEPYGIWMRFLETDPPPVEAVVIPKPAA